MDEETLSIHREGTEKFMTVCGAMEEKKEEVDYESIYRDTMRCIRCKRGACAHLQHAAEAAVKVCDLEQYQWYCNQGNKNPCRQHKHNAILDHLFHVSDQ